MKLSNFSIQPSLRKKNLGQGMTEYIIIVALIAIAAIGVFRLFGDTARNQVAAMASELGGRDGTTISNRASNQAAAAEQTAVTNRNLDNFANDNNN